MSIILMGISTDNLYCLSLKCMNVYWEGMNFKKTEIVHSWDSMAYILKAV